MTLKYLPPFVFVGNRLMKDVWTFALSMSFSVGKELCFICVCTMTNACSKHLSTND